MIKQRYICHIARNKEGKAIRYGIEVAGKVYPFISDPRMIVGNSTSQFLKEFRGIGNIQYWKSYARSVDKDVVAFSKAIIHVGGNHK